jgi:tetratricopeptide (TPR) repeat protein
VRRASAIAIFFAPVLVSFFVSGAARADADEDAARTAMRRGTAAMEAGDASRALSEFLLAKQLAPAANAPLFFAGEALEQLWRWREAVESFESYLAKDPRVSDADAVRARVAKIRAEHYPAHLHVVVDAPGAEVSVDHGPTAPPGTLELTPGRHRIEARAAGFEPSGTDVDAVGDTSASVTLVLSKTPPPAPVVPPLVTPPPASPAGVSWRTVGWIGAGVGAAGFLTTWILDAAVLGPKQKDYNDAASAGDVRRATTALRDANALRTGLLVGYVASGAVAATGAAVGLFAPDRRASIGAVAVPGSVAVSGSYSF